MEKKDLKPASVFHYFEEICRVPRPSKKEEKIRNYLVDFAKAHALEYKVDEAGNVLISKPATAGMENLKKVVLQSHMDMVCEKNNQTVHNFETDPIETYIDEEWLKAKGTTLGADNGIGMATELAVLAADDIQHGPLECLFTVDEETGLTGAFALKEGFMSGDILINLDSEDEGELFIGCAGGAGTTAEFPCPMTAAPEGYFFFLQRLSIRIVIKVPHNNKTGILPLSHDRISGLTDSAGHPQTIGICFLCPSHTRGKMTDKDI
jgi:dipeptidase D